MARGKKAAKELSPEEKLQQALVPVEEQPYPIPENWCWANLGAYIDFATDYVANGSFASLKENVQIYKEENYALMVKTADFANGFSKSLTYTDKQGYDYLDKSALHGGELILSNIGSIGKVFRVPFLNRPMTLASNSIMIKCYNEEDYDWLYYFFLSPIGLEELLSITTGTAVLKFNKTDLKTIALPVPPLHEQRRIVDRIKSLFAKLDEAKEKAQAVVDGFELRKSAILHKAFTGELTERWRKEHGVGMESWDNRTLTSVCRSIFDGDHMPPPKSENGIPFLVISNVNDGHLSFENTRFVPQEYYDSLSETRKPQIGDVLYTLVGSYGIPVVVDDERPFCFQRHMALLKPKFINTYFLWYLLQSQEMFTKASEIATGTAQLTVPIKGLRMIEFLCPSKNEQTEIVCILDSLLAQDQQAKEAAEAVLSQIDTMKKAILARAFRGELGTNDPAEESAVELIKAVL